MVKRPGNGVAGDRQWLWQSRRCLATIKLLWLPVWECCTDDGVLTTSPDHKCFMVFLIICLRLSL